MHKDLRRLLRSLEQQGATLRQGRSSSILVLPPDPKASAITLHPTCSDHRAMRNAVAQLRRSGFTV